MPDNEEWTENINGAMGKAAAVIAPNRRRLSHHDATTIVLESFDSHGYEIDPGPRFGVYLAKAFSSSACLPALICRQ